MAIETNNTGYTESASYYADPNNVEVPDQTHQEHNKGINSYILATLPGLITGANYDDEILNIKQANGLLAIRQAILGNTAVNSNYYYAVDEYEDQTGVDSTTMTYDAGTDSYRTAASSTHSLLIQSEESGTVTDGSQYFYDTSTNKAEITASGNAQTHIATLDSPYADDSSLAMTFDGSTSTYVSIPDSASLELGSSFEIKLWVKRNVGSVQQALCSKLESAPNRGWTLGVSSGNKLYFQYSTNGTDAISTFTTTSLSTGVWEHVGVISDGATVRFFIDGVEDATTFATPAIYTGGTQNVKIGSDINGALNGSIADVQIFNSTGGTSISMPTTKPTFSTESAFVWGSTSTGNIEDQAGNTLTLVGNVNVDASPYGGTEPVISFDGVSGSYLSAPDSALWRLDPRTAGSGFKISAWIKPANVTGTKAIISQINSTSTNRCFELYLNGATPSFLYYVTAGVGESFSSSITVSANAWSYIEVIGSNDQIEIFVNGNSGGTRAETGQFFDSTNVLEIGSGQNGVSDLFNGYISEPRIFNTAPASDYQTTSKPTVSTESLYVDHDITNVTFSDATGGGTVVLNGSNGTRHTLRDSKFGNSALIFNGGSGADGLKVTDSVTNANYCPAVSGAFTAECWFNPRDTSQNGIIMCQMASAGAISDMSWFLYYTAGNLDLYHSTNGTTATVTCTAAAGLSLNTWHHIAVSMDGSNVWVYVDGVQISTAVQPAYHQSTSDLTIGYRALTVSYIPLNGLVEEVSVLKGTCRYPDGTSFAGSLPAAPYSLATVDPDIDSITFTAGSAPTKIAVVTLMEPIDSVTVNTDYNIFVSPTASFANSQKVTLSYAGVEPSSGANMYVGEADISGLTSGTSIRYYLRGENGKDLRHHAIYLYYAD